MELTIFVVCGIIVVMAKVLPERITLARQKANIQTMAELARLMGVTREEARNWELGRRGFTTERLFQFCEVAGVENPFDLTRPLGETAPDAESTDS